MAFTGKVALVTGAGSGMGQVAALRLAEGGATVAALDVNEAGLAETARRGGACVTTFACDVSDEAEVQAVVEKVEADLGPIDRLVNAAGVMPGGAVLDMSTEAFLRPMKINYFGTVHLVKAVVPAMRARGRGDVILFGSVTGYVFTTNFAAYSASKAAVNAFTEILTHELRGSGLRVLLVAPSAVKTPLLQQAIDDGPPALAAAVRKGHGADPAKMIDLIEKAIERGTNILTPGEARATWALRRISPGLMWRVMDRMNRG